VATARARQERSSRFALRNWKLRSKQTVVLVVPLVTALILGSLRVATELGDAEEFSRTVTQVDLSTSVAELIDEIQVERDLVAGRTASGKVLDPQPVAAQTAKVDEKVTELRGAADSVEDLDQAVQSLYGRVLSELGTLDAIRDLTNTTSYPASDAVNVYQRVVASLLQLSGEITKVTDDRSISQRAETAFAISRAKEQAAVQNSILRVASISNVFLPGDLTHLRAAQAEFTAALADFDEAASPAARSRYAATVTGSDVGERLRLRQLGENRGELDQPVAIDPNQLDAATSGTLEKLRKVEIASLADVRNTAVQLVSTARSNAIRDAALIAGALLIALLLMLVVTRSLVRPLRVLRTNALEVAYIKLPATVNRILADPDPVQASRNAVDPVPVFTREETGEVARSFDAVHDQAVRMAAEQALLRDNINSIFVNLSRRSQALVERLLAVIDRLEREELDPNQLSNLFEVDHLATRMRRNSESLLVLSGTGLSRQLTRPVPAAEVVGAAVSEVEHYARIDVTTQPEVAVQGRAVNDLVHLIAELLDNATFFSEPEKRVTVRMSMSRATELVVQITDRGVGMSDEDIEVANARLADPPVLDVAVTRRMGLYVVARLAQKHNIAVRLRDNPDIEGGLVARITVPAELVSSLSKSPSSPRPTTGGTSWPPQSSLPSGSTSMSEPLTNPPTGQTPPPVTTGTGSIAIAQAFGGSLPVRNATESRPGPAALFPSTPKPTERGLPIDDRSAPPQEPSLFGSPLPEDPNPITDMPTERLPIYEAVLSQWFEFDTASQPRTDVSDEPTDTSTDTAAEVPAATATSLPEPAEDEPAQSNPTAEERAAAWVSPADDGWNAVHALLDSPAEDTLTTAGLPKRVRGARLVPGSAGPRQESPPAAAISDEPATSSSMPHPEPPGTPRRSAEAVRGRMAQFQQGVRRGRHALIQEPNS